MNELAKTLGDSAYVFLTLNLLWGLYCAIVVWRRLAQLRFRNEAQQAEFVEQLNECIAAGSYAEAKELCEGDTRGLPKLVALAIDNRDLEPADLRHFVAERLQRDIMVPLENSVSWIITVIRNGPLLGLFGTVLGMMAAFGRIGTGDKVEPSQIADEISVALICTAMGLGTAIPLGYIASTLNIRIADLRESLMPALVRFLKTFKPQAH